MAEFPALPIFTDAFIADTIHLNALQTGAYFMLLMVAWRTKSCSLPDNDDRLAAFARLDKRTWLKNKDVVMSFWHKNNNGEFYQKRLTDERKLAEDRRNQAVQAGRASALKRKERHSTDVITERELKGNYPKPKPLNHNIIVSGRVENPPIGDKSDGDNPQWFDGHVIRLKKKDYMGWLAMTGWSDDYFNRVLSERDDWLASEPVKAKNWFISTSKWLQKTSQQGNP